jgi:hypothetical protein
MTYRIGIALLIAVCACSITDPTPDPDPGSPEMGSAEQPTSPDSDSLPEAARLVPEAVDSVEDVPGRYAQPFALPGQVSAITLGEPNFATGTYELYRSCGVPNCVPEAGQYHIVPTNPAIGFAALSLVDQTGLVRSTYILDLLWRDGEGKLVAIQLRALLGNVTGPSQVWWRLPDTEGNPVPASAPETGVQATTDAPSVLAAPAPGNAKPKLGGVFVRSLPIYGDIGAVTLDEATWTETEAKGTYQASYPYCLPWCLGESGSYTLDLANIATGTGHLTLVPTGNPTQAHDYAVYAIWRTPEGTPSAIQLQRVDGVVASGPVFTVYRQWWTGATAAPAPEPANPATCATWLNLAAYYRIRALQCGMGACWALSPLYSSWAQYYQGLADAAGCTSTP